MINDIIKSDMDSNLLNVFVKVVETGSFSAACKELFCVQSNVTARIKQLEEDVGWNLFHRKSKGVVLTEAGEQLYRHAVDILRKLHEAEQSMKFLNHSGRLRIGSTESNAAIRLVSIMSGIHRDFPEIDLELQTGTTSEITQSLLNYKLDLAFVSGIPSHPELKTLKQYDETMVFVEPAIGKVPDVVIGFRKGCTYREALEDLMKRSGRPHYRVMEFGSLETILGCVSAGMGKTLLPLEVVEKLADQSAVNIKRLKEDEETIPTCMVCRADSVPMVIHDLFSI